MTTTLQLFAAAAFASSEPPPDDTNTYPEYMAAMNSLVSVLIFGKSGTSLTLIQTLDGTAGVNSPQCASMSPNGRWLIIANGSGDSTNFARVYRRTGDTFEYFDSLTGLPAATTSNVCLNPKWSSDSQYVALCVRGTGTDVLHVFRFVGDTITKCGGTVNEGSGAASVTFAPDASWVGHQVVGSDTVRLYKFDGTNILTDAPNTRTLDGAATGVADGTSYPDWDPTSQYLVCGNNSSTTGTRVTFWKRNVGETFSEISETGTPSITGANVRQPLWYTDSLAVHASNAQTTTSAVGVYRRTGDAIAAVATAGATGGRGGYHCNDAASGNVFINGLGNNILYRVPVNTTTGAATAAVTAYTGLSNVTGTLPRIALSIGTIPV